MIKHLILFILFLISINSSAQTKILSKSKLIIKHPDLTLYLTADSCSMVSKHIIRYVDFKKLDDGRDNKWFDDTYPGKYIRSKYKYSGYDLGHLTPSHITSYDDNINHYSFSLYNQAPQLAQVNRGKWMKLESDVEKIISTKKSNAIIITGVIYDFNHSTFLPNSNIRIPVAFFKILYISKVTYCWIASNVGVSMLISTDLKTLNKILKRNKMPLVIY
jgi:hypothetical protein